MLTNTAPVATNGLRADITEIAEAAGRNVEFDGGLITFPIAFPNAVRSAHVTIFSSSAPLADFDMFGAVSTLNTTQIRPVSGSHSTGTRSFGLRWFALGN